MKLIKQDVKFGNRSGRVNSDITVIQLSPEQTERLRNGESYDNVITGDEPTTVEPYVRRDVTVWKTPLSRIDISFYRYQELRLEMNDEEIRRKLNMSANILTKLKRQWGLID